MSRRKLKPVSPGEMLREEFLRPLHLTNQVARALGVPANRITGILNNTRGITADTALRLARYFDTTPEFWMNLQSRYDLGPPRTASPLKSNSKCGRYAGR